MNNIKTFQRSNVQTFEHMNGRCGLGRAFFAKPNIFFLYHLDSKDWK
jgi:hypothetical protein